MRQRGSAKNSMPKSTIWPLPLSFLCLKMYLKSIKSLEVPWRGFKSCVGKGGRDVDDKDTKKESIKRKGGE